LAAVAWGRLDKGMGDREVAEVVNLQGGERLGFHYWPEERGFLPITAAAEKGRE